MASQSKNHLGPAVRLYLFFTVLLGLGYPLAMTGIGQALFPQNAGGNFLSRGGQQIGSELIGQNFEQPIYFWSRPSAVSYNPLPSGGSNVSIASDELKKQVEERRAKLQAAHPGATGEIPSDLLFASASGLDPHISLAAAAYQSERVANARKLPLERVNDLIKDASRERQWGLFGEPTVNVLALNMALDKEQGILEVPKLLPTPEPGK